MADLALLVEAENLLAQARDLKRQVDAEVAAAEATRAAAARALDQVLAAGHAAAAHLGYLGAEQRRGLEQQISAVKDLSQSAATARECMGRGLAEALAAPVLLERALQPSLSPLVPVPELHFKVPDVVTVRSFPLADRSAQWDVLAMGEVSTLEDIFEKAAAELERAEATLLEVETTSTRSRQNAGEILAERERK